MTYTITPTVSNNILSQIPRFFSGRQAMVREIFQNAHRAGASSLSITINGQNVTFYDNGPGLENPAVLLNVAKSDWQSGVFDPAGIGVLSTLNPELSTRVTFQSHGWTFSLTPEEFAQGKEIEVLPAPEKAGFSVTLELAEGQEPFNEKEMIEARAYCPVTLIYEGEEYGLKGIGGYKLEIPEGTLYLGVEYKDAHVFWEGFPTLSSLRDYLLNRKKPISKLQQTIIELCQMAFFPHPHSGLSPKLPDRNAFIEDAAYEEAALSALSAIENLITNELEKVVQDKNVIHIGKVTPSSPSAYLTGRAMQTYLRSYLQDKGYEIRTLFGENTYLEFSRNGEGETYNTTEVAYKTSPSERKITDDQLTALSFLQKEISGLPFSDSQMAESQEQTALFTGITPGVSFNPDIPFLEYTITKNEYRACLCNQLKVQGIGVPWFIHKRQLLFLGDAKVARKTFEENEETVTTTLLHSIWLSGDVFDNLDLEEGDSVNIDGGDVRYSIVKSLNDLLPNYKEIQNKIGILDSEEGVIKSILHGINASSRISSLFDDVIQKKLREELENLRVEQKELQMQLQNLLCNDSSRR